MPTFMHAADLHLDSPLRGLDQKPGAPVERIRGASRKAFQDLVSATIERQVTFAVLVGDIYDTQPAFETYRFFHEQVKRLVDAGIPVAIVLGNHDHAGVSPRAGRLPVGVHVLSSREPETLEIVPGVVVHGQSYSRRDVSEDLARDYPMPVAGKLNVGLLHTALDGHAGEHAAYAPSNRTALANHGYEYWALGHVHTHIVLQEAGGVHLVYPGNLQGRHARETGPKGAVFVDYEGNQIQEVAHEAFDDVRWHHVQVNAASLPEGGDPVREIEKRVLQETAATRSSGRLAAARVSISGEASGGLLDLGSVEVRESLLANLGVDAALFVERIHVDLQTAATGRSEAERLLRKLVQELAKDADQRRPIAKLSEQVRRDLCKVDTSLGAKSRRLSAQGGNVSDECVREQLEWSLGLVRDLLYGTGGGA